MKTKSNLCRCICDEYFNSSHIVNCPVCNNNLTLKIRRQLSSPHKSWNGMSWYLIGEEVNRHLYAARREFFDNKTWIRDAVEDYDCIREQCWAIQEGLA